MNPSLEEIIPSRGTPYRTFRIVIQPVIPAYPLSLPDCPIWALMVVVCSRTGWGHGSNTTSHWEQAKVHWSTGERLKFTLRSSNMCVMGGEKVYRLHKQNVITYQNAEELLKTVPVGLALS